MIILLLAVIAITILYIAGFWSWLLVTIFYLIFDSSEKEKSVDIHQENLSKEKEVDVWGIPTKKMKSKLPRK